MDSQSVSLSLTKSPAAIVIPFLAFFATLLSIPPFVTHVKSHNLAAAALIFWVTQFNFFNFINALIWPTDNIPSWYNGAGLCDIEVKLQDAANVGGPGALACIFRQLAIILDTERTVLSPSRAQRRKKLAIEITLCFAFPAWMLIAQYIVQPKRYYIFAIAGCNASYDNSWLSIVLIFVWPLALCILDGYYCGTVIYRLIHYRRQFSSILSSSSSNTSRNRFIRLFAMALTFTIIFLPANAYVFARNLGFARHTFSWSKVHGPGWNEIIKVPTYGAVLFDRWVQIGVGLASFGFFGFGRDAMEMYQSWIKACGLGRIFPGRSDRHGGSDGDGKSSHLASASAGSSLGVRLGSVSSRARLIFHKRSHNDSPEMSRTDSLLPPLPLHTSTKRHLTPAFGANLETNTTTTNTARASRPTPPLPPPAYRWSWQSRSRDRGMATADEDFELANALSGGGDGRTSEGSGSGSVETAIWAEKDHPIARPMGKGEVKVVSEMVQV